MLIQENISLAPLTTFRIGGPARWFATVRTEDELLESLAFARSRSLRTAILGGGSNLLVSDAGFYGLILHLTLGSAITVTEHPGGHLYQVGAGVDWDAFVLRACQDGAGGVECLAGIPGLTGASPIQNIGAYGQEVAQTIASVRALDRETLSFVELPREACAFAYRTSLFNSTARDRYILTRVDFLLAPGARPNLSYADLAPLRERNPAALDVYHAVRAIRDGKGMLIDPERPRPDTRSAGSFFKNPIVPAETLDQIAATLAPDTKFPHWPAPDGQIKLPAAWLIEQAGFPKGFTLGPVGISTRHTLALTNRSGEATCAELLALRDLIVRTVAERFGVTLHQEPVFLA